MPFIPLPRGGETILEVRILHKHTAREVHVLNKVPTKVVEPLKLRRISLPVILLVLLSLFTGNLSAQEPTPFLEESELISGNCTTLLDLDDDITPYGSILNEEWTTIGVDTFVGFWQFQRFFVPSKGIALSFYDCGVTYEVVPSFGDKPIAENSRPVTNFFTWKSNSASQWARHIGYLTAGIAGYCGGQAEYLRFTNGLPIHNGDAYHLNRDLSLWGLGGTGIALSTSWFKDPNLKWWVIPVDIVASFVSYQLGKEIGYYGN